MPSLITTRPKSLKSISFILLFLFNTCLTAAFPAHADSFQGKVISVSDGDTITVMHKGSGERIRLHGIDAPERSQDFGNRAKQYVGSLIFGKQVTVISNGTDKYGRTLGTVTLSKGEILNHEILRNGYAWWYKKYAPSDTELARLEAQARRERRGLWIQPKPIPPWEFRHAISAPGATPINPLPSGKLPILGNRKSRIYHLSNCDTYSKISPRNRVRFTDEKAAQRAGYRLARNCS